MASATTVRQEARPVAPSRPPIILYALLTFLFVVVVGLQVMSTALLHDQGSFDSPGFLPAQASAAVGDVEPKATAAGLRRGDILVAINGRPYTGTGVFFEEWVKTKPGSTFAVTVRSPGANLQERTVRIPMTLPESWTTVKTTMIAFAIVMPFFCIALGFWVVLVRPRDPSAWLLLGLLLSFTQLGSAYPVFARWGSGSLKMALGYGLSLKMAWPVFMFLFGFFFPEPLPFFQRPGRWRKRLPWLVIAPYTACEVALVAFSVAAVTRYSAAGWLDPVFALVAGTSAVYAFCLIGGFFGFIFTKSAVSISPDAKRRLRLLYWGATFAMTPALLLALTELMDRNRVDPPAWVAGFVVLMLLLFPLTLAYVIVVQRAMDVRVVLRQGLQYALARNGVRVLQALAVLLVTLTALALIGQKSERPQKLIVIALGLLAVFSIRRLADKLGAWVDRRFFREAYDAEQVLSELSDSVRSMVEERSLIKTVAERIAHTLHISRIAVLLGGGGRYRPAYALGYGSAPDIVFPAGAGTVKVLERQKEPARVYFDDPHSWVYREPDVTEEDRSKLTQLDAEVLLPLSTRDKLLGFISLGPKLSDEPYAPIFVC